MYKECTSNVRDMYKECTSNVRDMYSNINILHKGL